MIISLDRLTGGLNWWVELTKKILYHFQMSIIKNYIIPIISVYSLHYYTISMIISLDRLMGGLNWWVELTKKIPLSFSSVNYHV